MHTAHYLCSSRLSTDTSSWCGHSCNNAAPGCLQGFLETRVNDNLLSPLCQSSVTLSCMAAVIFVPSSGPPHGYLLARAVTMGCCNCQYLISRVSSHFNLNRQAAAGGPAHGGPFAAAAAILPDQAQDASRPHRGHGRHRASQGALTAPHLRFSTFSLLPF